MRATIVSEAHVAEIRTEQRKVAFEDAGRQYDIFQREQRKTVQQSQATVDDLTSQVAALQAQLISRDKSISRLERSLQQTQEALDQEDARWEAEEYGYWGDDGIWYEYEY